MSAPGQDVDAALAAHGDELLRLAFHLTGDRDRAVDLLRTALAKWSLARPPADPVRVLIRTAVSRRPIAGLTALTGQTGQPGLPGGDDAAELIVEVGHDQLDEQTLVLGAFQQLAPRHRAVLALRIVEDRTAAAVDELLPGGELDHAVDALAAHLAQVEPIDLTDLRARKPDPGDTRSPVADSGVVVSRVVDRGWAGSGGVDRGAVEARLRRAFRDRPVLPDGFAASIGSRAWRIRWGRRTGVVAAVAAVAAGAVVVPQVIASLVPPTDELAAVVVPPRPTYPPIGLPSGPAPAILYAENTFETGGGFLHDGPVQVPTWRGWRFVPFGRVANGWLVVIAEAHDFADGQPHHGGVGIYTRDGEWHRLGDAAGWNATLSPDGRRIAYLAPSAAGTSVVVLDLATRSRVAARPAGALLGWNSAGIWYRTSSPWVWQPGSAPRSIRDAGLIEVHKTTSWVTEHTEGCVAVAALRPDGDFARGPRRCGDGVLSPTGEYVEVPRRAARAIAAAGLTDLPLGDAIRDTVWEDARRVLLHVSAGDGLEVREVVIRCDVADRRCELAYDSAINGSPPNLRLTLHEP